MRVKKLLMLGILITFLYSSVFAQKNKTTIILNVDLCKDTISKHIYGQFSEHLGSCIYGGIWVGENSSIPNTRGIRNDVVAALKRINIPNLRWPGGCFADEYHWMDGIGPREKRPKMVNTNWGGVVEDNSFGTHEFLDLCEQLGAEPYITGNVGSGSVEEMAKWVEYITSDGESPMANLRKQNGREKPWKIKFWGVGNESWGCGGRMSPSYYSDLYKRYSLYCRNYGSNKLYKIACGPNGSDYDWMTTLLKETQKRGVYGVSLHYYVNPKTPEGKRGSATNFNEAEYFNTVKECYFTEELISKHSTIMDAFDPDKKLGLMVDEWGNWYEVEPGTNPGFLYQQNTLRDAITAGISLNIFNNHCDRVKMTNIAQVVNVLQSMILTDGSKMILTPTFFVFEMYKHHQGAALIPINYKSPSYELNGKKIPAVSASASKDKNGVIHITFVNANPKEDIQISCEFRGTETTSVNGKILTAKELNVHNTFENPNAIQTEDFKDASVKNGTLSVKLPSKSVVMLELK